MMTIDEIRALLNDLESDRVERTISTTNTDKFEQERISVGHYVELLNMLK